jgi:hypothetical protein
MVTRVPAQAAVSTLLSPNLAKFKIALIAREAPILGNSRARLTTAIRSNGLSPRTETSIAEWGT